MKIFYKRLLGKKGFTLIELLVTLAVFSVLMVAVLGFVIPSMNLFAASSRQNSAKHATNLIFDYIEGNLASTTKCKIFDGNITNAQAEQTDDMLILAVKTNGADPDFGTVMLYKKSDPTGTPILTDAITDGLEFNVKFLGARIAALTDPAYDVLTVQIEARDSKTKKILYTMERNIYLMNMNPGVPNQNVVTASGSSGAEPPSAPEPPSGGGGAPTDHVKIEYDSGSLTLHMGTCVLFKDYSMLGVEESSSTSST